jgi:putative ABC transport system permease protein
MIALATLRHRWAAFVGSFVALALGVAVLAATLVVFVSAQPAVPDRLAAAAVVVRAPAAGPDEDPFEEYVPWPAERASDLARRLADIPGVAAAVPDRSFYAQPVRGEQPLGEPTDADPLGHAWSTTALAPFRLTEGAPPAGPGEVALGTRYGFAPGSDVTLLTATGPSTWRVTGTVDGPGVYLADAVAATYAPGVTAIGLVLEPGTDAAAVAAAARIVAGTDGTVLTGSALTALEPEADARTRWIGTQLLTVTVLLAAFATVFVMASTSALAAYQRRREVGLLRAVGATPRQIRRMLLGEALGVAVVAAVAGAGLGTLLAPVLGDLLVRAGMEPAGFTPRPSVLPIAAAMVGGVVVALLGAASAARRAARVRPLDALREAAVDRRLVSRTRWTLGGLALGGGVALAVLTPVVDADAAITTALFSAMALIAGSAAWAPAWIPPVMRVLAAPLGWGAGATGLLVRESAVAAVRRTAATVAPVLLTVGFATLVFGLVATASPAFGTADARASGAVAVVAPVDGTPGLTDAAVATVRSAEPPVLFSSAFVAVAGRPPVAVDVAGTDAAGLVTAASVAAANGWRTGAPATLVMASGERVSYPVTAVRPDAELPSPVVLPRAVVRAHDRSALTPHVFAAERPSWPSSAPVGARVEDPLAFSSDDEEDRLVWLFALVMIALSAGYTGIAVANTIVMATGDRRADFAALRRAGATARQVVRAVTAETGLVVLVGVALGLAVALPALLGIRAALAESMGGPVALVLPWEALGPVVATCAGLALVAATAATRATLRNS